MLELLFSKFFKRLKEKKEKKIGLLKIKKFNTSKGEDILNLIYYMTEAQNLDYKLVEILREF